jgi:hypothetical protein
VLNFLENDTSFWAELVAVGLGENLEVFLLVVAQVLNFALFDQTDVNVATRA